MEDFLGISNSFNTFNNLNTEVKNVEAVKLEEFEIIASKNIKIIDRANFFVIYFSKNNYDITSVIDNYSRINFWDCIRIALFLMYRSDFSLVIYDKGSHKLYILRSPNGVVPLYFYFKNKKLIVSMLVHFVAKTMGNGKISDLAIHQLFSMDYLMEPYTFYDDVYEIKRNYVYEFDLLTYELNQKKYYDLEYNISSNKSLNGYLSDLKNEMLNAHEKRINFNNGIFLSGGIDSVAICYCLTNIVEKNRLRAFNVSVEGQINSEVEYAKAASNYFDIPFEEIKVSPNCFDVSLPQKIINSNFPYWGILYIGGILQQRDLHNYSLFTGQDTRLHTPYLNIADSITFFASKNVYFAKVLSELSKLMIELVNKKNSKFFKILERTQNSEKIYNYVIKNFFHSNIADKVTNDIIIKELEKIFKRHRTLNLQQFFNEITWVKWGQQYTDDIKYMDSLCNFFDSQCQFPFYDIKLSEVSASIPFKYSNKKYIGRSSFDKKLSLNNKFILKKLLERERIPESIVTRKKAVSTTNYLFFNGPIGEMIKEYLNESKLKDNETICNLQLDSLMKQFCSEKRLYTIKDDNYLVRMYNLFILDVLQRNI